MGLRCRDFSSWNIAFCASTIHSIAYEDCGQIVSLITLLPWTPGGIRVEGSQFRVFMLSELSTSKSLGESGCFPGRSVAGHMLKSLGFRV